MRGAQILSAALIALAVAGCARQQQTYYVIDPATGQPVPVMTQQQMQAQQPQYAQPQYAEPQQYAQPSYGAPQYQQQQAYQQAPTYERGRGLYSNSPASAQQAYAQPPYTQPQYGTPGYQVAAPQAAPAPSASRGRGLFSSGLFSGRSRRTQTYVQVPQYQAQQYGGAATAQGGPYVAAPAASGYAAASPYEPAYTLDAGDKLRIVVFGQEGITNSYMVDAGGNLSLPLIGTVPARGFSTQQLSKTIAERLKQGYVREPHVSVEIEAYRPFFILGEVTTPGQYPYVANMTAETAVAIAGGFGPRADKRTVELTRNAPGQQFRGKVPLAYQLRPGDTVVVKERWF